MLTAPTSSDATTACPDTGDPPALDWIEVSLIDIDHAYQRELDEARVKKILAEFAWSSFGAVVLAPYLDGRYHATDGQHRLEAARRHPKVSHVPAIIITASGREVEAANFLALNRDRKAVTALQFHAAAVAAGDPDAVTIAEVCERAGVKLLRWTSGGNKLEAGETVAVAAIKTLVSRRHPIGARRVLEILVKAECAPISAAQVRAVEALLFDPEYAGHVDPDDLASTIERVRPGDEAEAARFAATHRIAVWKALASVWFKACRKRRAPGAPQSAAPAARTSVAASAPAARAPTPSAAKPATASPARLIRPIAPARPGMTTTAAAFGDPIPGRSALDQKEASRG